MKKHAIPDKWPKSVRSAILQAASLAHAAMIHTRSWCANSKIHRVKLVGQLDQTKTEIALLREEMRIKDARMTRLPAHSRPLYSPTERLAILELKTSRGWNLAQTAKAFLLEPDTISVWLKRVDDDLLVNTHDPTCPEGSRRINKFPALARYLVQRLKTLCPAMGKKRIAETLARAGLKLAVSSVGRFLKAKPVTPQPDDEAKSVSDESGRVVTAKYPNHVWNIDLTVVPTTSGFWQTWFPFSLLQCWPFCYWVAIVIDHYSRKIVGFAVFKKQPTSLDIRAFIGRVIRAAKASPRHLISDRGKQFDCAAFRKWAKRRKIKLRYGAIGKYGSIAVIERFILSLKSEFTNHLLTPFEMDKFRHELTHYVEWYNGHRPHQALGGRTPQEIYTNAQPLAPPDNPVPNSKLPAMKLTVSYLHGNRLLPLVEIKKAA